MKVSDRLQHAWNAFMNKDPTEQDFGYSYSFRPDRPVPSRGNEKTTLTSIYNRIATDCAAIAIEHVRLDDNGRFLEIIDSGLNNCLNLSANIDQTGRALIHDTVFSMEDEGIIAMVPVDTDIDITNHNSFDILSMRTGKITAWYPNDVKINLYNEKTAKHQEIILPKKSVAIVENPFYAVMNQPNSTAQRLKRKLLLLDRLDEDNVSNRLDLIVQLPYTLKSPKQRELAEQRRKNIEMQLTGSKYGIAYTDGTEKITQLNRPIDNQLMSQIEYLTSTLYSQLGITKGIMEGTASDQELTNYYNRTIEPIMSALTDEMKRKFLTKTARSQKQSICFFRDPFKLVPVTQLAEIADKFTRNEIMSSNEIRQIVGMKPSKDPRADELRNSNVSESKDAEHINIDGEDIDGLLTKEEENQNEE